MRERLNFWHHFLISSGFCLYLLKFPFGFLYFPFITFQVLVCKKFSFTKALWFHFMIGLFCSLIGSSLKIGVFSLILCLNYLTLLPFKRLFIDDNVFASSLYASLFGLNFSLGEFFLYQIFFSDIPFTISQMTLHFGFKLITDFCVSLLIFSWLYFVDFSIVKLYQFYKHYQERKKEKLSHAK